MGTGSGSLVGRGGNSYFLKSSTGVCVLLNVTECLKSVSYRGKMIPAELEKQIWQARKEVRGKREERGKENVCMCLGVRERMPGRECKPPDLFLGVGLRIEHVSVKIG